MWSAQLVCVLHKPKEDSWRQDPSILVRRYVCIYKGGWNEYDALRRKPHQCRCYPNLGLSRQQPGTPRCVGGDPGPTALGGN